MSFKREERVQVVGQDSPEKEVCRDFKNGHCSRGEGCRYDHPKSEVCRDFQNGKCTRKSCRFIHISRQEEETYVNSGSLPAHIKNGQSMFNNGMNGIQLGGFDFKAVLGKRKIVDFATPMSYGQEINSVADLCRDFEKGECSRGGRCKYYHPKLIICRDFQKEKCEREKCRFLHMTREEEDAYEGSGVVPDHIDKEEVRKKRVMNPSSVRGATGMSEMYGKRTRDDNFASMGGLPNTAYPTGILQENPLLAFSMVQSEQQLCRDFEKGECSRADRCKYYHPKLIICRDFQKDKCEREKCRFLHMTREEEDEYNGSGVVPDHIDKADVRKKRVMAPPSTGGTIGVGQVYGTQGGLSNTSFVGTQGGLSNASFAGTQVGLSNVSLAGTQVGLSNVSLAAAVEENMTLKLKLTEMQQQLTDLRKMNDTLYEQNSNYRKYR